MPEKPDVAVIGSGPNGLAAAIRMAQAGRSVTVYEAAATPGGAVRSAELTLPGITHDPFAAVFPIALASSFFRTLGLDEHGLTWIEPNAPLAHPLEDGTAVVLDRSIERTASGLGADRESYMQLMQPIAADSNALADDLLAPPGAQRHFLAMARFGQHAIRSATGFACSHFHGDEARALLAGNAAHSFLSLEAPLTAGFALFLAALGHTGGWPIPRGGAASLTAALVNVLQSLGGRIVLDHRIGSLSDLPPASTLFFDTDPRQMATIAGSALPSRFGARLRRHRFGPGVFKIDYALDGPMPWTAKECLNAGTIHVGGTMEEIALSEYEVTRGRHAEKPFMIVSQPSLFDATRAPGDRQTLWAYCHVPAGSDIDMTERMERQIERFAPDFRDRVLARHTMNSRQLHDANANLVGGAINGGVQDVRSYLGWTISRPSPYATPNPAIFRCSAACPPGGGVHGMAGFHAAEFALRAGR